MESISTVALCVAAALGALGAASLAASAAEWGFCTATKNAKYADSNCTKAALTSKSGVPKGRYEWEPAGTCYATSKKDGNYTESGCKAVAEKGGKPDHKGAFELAVTPNNELVTRGTTGISIPQRYTPDIECPPAGQPEQPGHSEGELTGPTSGIGRLALKYCSTNGFRCYSGETFETLDLTFDMALTEPKNGEARIEMANRTRPGAPVLSTFECWLVASYSLRGAFTERVTPVNEMTLTYSLAETDSESLEVQEGESGEWMPNWIGQAQGSSWELLYPQRIELKVN